MWTIVPVSSELGWGWGWGWGWELELELELVSVPVSELVSASESESELVSVLEQGQGQGQGQGSELSKTLSKKSRRSQLEPAPTYLDLAVLLLSSCCLTLLSASGPRFPFFPEC